MVLSTVIVIQVCRCVYSKVSLGIMYMTVTWRPDQQSMPEVTTRQRGNCPVVGDIAYEDKPDWHSSRPIRNRILLVVCPLSCYQNMPRVRRHHHVLFWQNMSVARHVTSTTATSYAGSRCYFLPLCGTCITWPYHMVTELTTSPKLGTGGLRHWLVTITQHGKPLRFWVMMQQKRRWRSFATPVDEWSYGVTISP